MPLNASIQLKPYITPCYQYKFAARAAGLARRVKTGSIGRMPSPDLLQQDADNRSQALALSSCIVEAPAGAGKTELLTQRYLKLLALVREPEEIVAITFTNKAAAEMRGRVLQSLQAAADDVPVDQPHTRVTRKLALAALERARALEWDLLAQPGRLRINTIDSLCSLLARQMPLLSRFGGQPKVLEDAALHYQEAARQTLAMLEDETDAGPVTEALRYFDNDGTRLAAQLAAMLAKRDQWLPHGVHHAVPHEAENALHRLLAHDIARAAAVLTPDLQAQLRPVARYAAANLAGDSALAPLLDWQTPLAATPQALPMWRGVCALLLTEKDTFRKSVNVKQGFPPGAASQAHKAALAGVIAALPDSAPLARLRQLPEAANEEEWRIVGVLARLLHLAAAHLLTVFQQAGEVDFIEVASRALQALEDDSGPTDLALRLDYRIQHLLVDEFQDTSPTQVKLLQRLSAGWEPGDGRSLFCVGDPMQSIYRFRKADVGLFLQAAEYGIGQLPLRRLHLTRNNRSCPAVVDWVNTTFARVFPEHDSMTRGAIRYRPFAATRATLPGEGVELHPLVVTHGSDGLAALEARYLAGLIVRERARYPGSTIAVLVRARHHLEALVAEIRRHHAGLRFQAVEVEALAGRQAIQDVLALTRALYHRADRLHWLAILRAPWCGLTLNDLHVLAADDHAATLWQLMQDEARLARLSEDGRQRLLHVRGIVAEALAQQGRQSARRWVESTWLRLGGPHCLWEAGDVRDVQALFDLIEQHDSARGFDPEQLEQAVSKLYATPDVQADGRLQFMTIHKSKGLEFDTVILPGLHRPPRNSDAPLLLWEEVAMEDDASQLIAAPWVPKPQRDERPSAYDYLQALERERAANESARALYVAATRAVRRLHLVGVVKQDAKGELSPPTNSFLQLLWSSLGAEFATAVPQDPPPTGDESGFTPKLLRLPQAAMPELLRQLATLPAQAAASGASEAESIEPGSLAADCGTLAHLYLQMIARDGAENWDTPRLKDLQPAMCAWLGARGHAAEAEAGAVRVQQALSRTLASADGQWVLRHRSEAASELALTAAEQGQTATYVVDRTFIEEGVRWVIDYKSAQLDESLPEPELVREAARHQAQLQGYAALFKHEGRAIRLAVFFIAHGRLVELV